MEGMDTITPRPRPVWVAGHAEHGGDTLPVTHPYDGTEVATVAVPDAGQVERAVATAARFAGETRSSPARARVAVLDRTADALATRAEEFAELLTAECATPLRWAKAEVTVATASLRLGARLAGETRFVEGDAAGAAGLTLVSRVPHGAALGVLPFHTPLASAARAVAAAFAVGAPVVLAPSSWAPLSALALGELLADALTGSDVSGTIPDGVFSVLPGNGTDTRIPALTAALATDGRLTRLDPGCGHASAVVLPDWPDLASAAALIAAAGTASAGQACAAVRRVLVPHSLADEFVPALTAAVRAQHVGDPYDAAVSVGPLADEAAAQRVVAWIDEAVAAGARLVTGGSRTHSVVEPTLLIEPAPGTVEDRGVLGPILTVSMLDSADEAFAAAGCARAGVFTRDTEWALRASADIDASEIVIGDVPRTRADDVRPAIRQLTKETTTVLALPGREWSGR